ncbi:PCI domain-containing protein 2 homolog (dmPCID2) (CSN12-like protein) [Durusdinium trenchii]|uniref:PCI domain-containing protein 2 homolog (DmPCID2) (CSN12-like protein) n=1 Tax=Durusdinium trenchii TaxID=1381693 RepID=A0ABP0I7E4_9DINO
MTEVFEHNLQGADEKLTWAFNNCPEKFVNMKEPRLNDSPPSPSAQAKHSFASSELLTELLHKYDLDVFVDVVKAIKEGNVQLFNSKMQELSAVGVSAKTNPPKPLLCLSKV